MASVGRRRYPLEVKAAAMAALLEGQSLSAVAAQYKIPVGTVHSWHAEIKGRRANPVLDKDTRKGIGERLLDYLDATLVTLRAQNEVFSDVEWLKKQDASELAVLHGVQTDKAIRLLEAMGNVGGDAASGE